MANRERHKLNIPSPLCFALSVLDMYRRGVRGMEVCPKGSLTKSTFHSRLMRHFYGDLVIQPQTQLGSYHGSLLQQATCTKPPICEYTAAICSMISRPNPLYQALKQLLRRGSHHMSSYLLRGGNVPRQRSGCRSRCVNPGSSLSYATLANLGVRLLCICLPTHCHALFVKKLTGRHVYR